MKKLIIPNSIDLIKKTSSYANSYLVGIKDLSVNVGLYLTLDQLKQLLSDISDKEIFVALNKNMRNSDLEFLKQVLVELNKLNIAGIFYYDTAVYNLCDNKDKLIWSMEHATTNYATINYWFKKGVKQVYLSSEITLDEIREIKANTSSRLFVNVFGYLPIFLSKRYLITNYKRYFNLDDDSKLYYMEKENKKYPVLESSDGTAVYSCHILNAYNDIEKLSDIDYLVFNSFLIPDDAFINVLEAFDKKLGKDKIDMLLDYNTDDAFFHKETIYKVIK